MPDDPREWRPGSFTKNFSWGPPAAGLRQLWDTIRLGFAEELKPVTRAEFRGRIANTGRPDYIPLNFFLFNKPIDGVDHILVDELVFQALTAPHSPSFDKLALFAFNLSMAGTWRGAERYQRWPALWSYYYIKDRVSREFDWNLARANANDIEQFVGANPKYRAKSARKLATNLNYLYKIGGLSDFSSNAVQGWWVNCLFLTLDRILEDRGIDGRAASAAFLSRTLDDFGFIEISGRRTLEKELAAQHLATLYAACGGASRFDDDLVKEITSLKIQDVEWLLANDNRPQGAIHPTNPRILKTIPRACALLAKYAGFEVIETDELATFDAEEFIRRRTKSALRNLSDRKIKPIITADELTKITRDR